MRDGFPPAPARAPVRSASRVYALGFNAALVLWVVGSERFIAVATAAGAPAVIAAWLGRGHDRILLSSIWVVAGLAFAGLAAALARHVFVAATGRPEPYILLGPAENGFYAAHEPTRPWTPAFVPDFIGAPPAVVWNRQAVYQRLWLLADREGNLTPVAGLNALRVAGLVLLEALALAVGALPCIVVAGSYLGGLDAGLRVPHAWDRLHLPPHALAAAVTAWVLVHAAILVFIAGRRGRRLPEGRVLPLPAPLATGGAVLTGTVVDAVQVAGLTGSASRWPRHYRRYTVRLDGPEFPLPVHVQWQARRIHSKELDDASRRLRRELERAQADHEAIFAVLDEAMRSRAPTRWRLTDGLALVPDIAGVQVWDDETAAPEPASAP